MTLAVPPSLTEAFARCIWGLQAVLGTEQGYKAQATGKALAIAVLQVIGARIAGLQKQFNEVVDRLRAGTLPKPRERHAGAPPRAYAPRPGAEPPVNPFPFRLDFAWLIPKVTTDRHVLAHWHNVFNQLLAEPDMKAVIEAAPRQMARILRPLCWMLGTDPDQYLPPRPKRPRRSRRSGSGASPEAGPARPARPRRPRPARDAVPPPPPKPWPWPELGPRPDWFGLPDGRMIDLRHMSDAERWHFIQGLAETGYGRA